jgi:hypothetical protein
MGARNASDKAKLALAKGALARKKYRAQMPLARVVIAMVYPFAPRAVEPRGPATRGKGRVLRAVRTASSSTFFIERPAAKSSPVEVVIG